MKPITASGIPVHCAHARLADVTTLVANPRNPNKHGDAQVALLAKIIRHQGWRAPITISKRSGFIVTGHGRLQAALLLQVEKVPVDEQNFATEADEWAHLIADNRIAELAEADRSMLRDLAEELDTGDFDMELTGFDAAALEELMTAAPPDEVEYTKTVPSVTYEMTRPDKPSIAEIYDGGKTAGLIEKIKAAKLPPDEEAFLIAAAQRHTVFNFENIAEYYAHSSAEVQDLMEQSALVIVDFKKAIEYGFLNFTDSIKALIGEEAGNDEA